MAQKPHSGRTGPRVSFKENRNASATKSGPGRFHSDGLKKHTHAASAGAGVGFTLHRASAAKLERRALIAVHGRRAAIKQIKADRFNAKEQASITA